MKEGLISDASNIGDSNISITAHGRPHLGVPIGTKEYKDTFIQENAKQWCEEVEKLSNITETQPHAAYAALTHDLSSKWLFLLGTTANISKLLPLESTLQTRGYQH